MACPSCETRKPKRLCPALGRTICTVCCGTKRLVEIPCPDDCPYLSVAREHPASAVKQQQERDVAVLLPSINGLTERQHQLFFLFHAVIARYVPEGLARLTDADVADAAAAMAATLETAAKGVIYEHQATTVPGRKLLADMNVMLTDLRARGVTVFDREAAMTLRAIERGARETGGPDKGPAGTDTAYLVLMARLLQMNRAGTPKTTDRESSPLILP